MTSEELILCGVCVEEMFSTHQNEMSTTIVKPIPVQHNIYSTEACDIQWNLSNPDTLGTEESVLISEVSWVYIVHKHGIWDSKKCPVY